MLALPIAFIKDAARSVKRICEQEFTKVTDNALTDLLGISCLVVTMFSLRREGGRLVLHLMCAHRNGIAICPKCGAVTEDIHEEKERCIRHLDIWGKVTFLHFLSRRFKCGCCGKPFTEELEFVDQSRRQSLDFEMHIYRLCLSDNRKAVADREGLSHSAVKGIFFRIAKMRLSADKRSRCPRVLGIDEISLKKRHKQFVLVLSDIDRRCILDILPERSKEALEAWIDRFDESQKRSIRYVSIDMWGPYRYAVANKLPKARIVVDRFHVMKQLNSRINTIRKKYQRTADEPTQKVLKRSRWLLLKNRQDLTEKDEEKLKRILDACPELRTVYLQKEEFRFIFERAKTRDKADKYLRAWKLKVQYGKDSHMAKFVKTLDNWWNEILNYFIERITNGFVEGLNGAIRVIIRRAFGYRNFSSFRLQAMAEHNLPTNPR